MREKYIENTKEGFSGARLEGIDGVELDVQLSKDGRIIVFHDYDSLRLLGINRKIYDLSYEEISKMKIEGSNETVPTLEEVLSVAGNLLVFIELKTIDDNFSEVNQGLEEKVVKLLRVNRHKNFYVISFNPRSIAILKSLDPKIHRGLLIDNDTIHIPKNINTQYLQSIGAEYLLPSFELKDETWVKDARDAGFGIIFWNVFDFEQAEEARDFGAMGVITDSPLAIRKRMRQ
ncbi:MAG: glycerophosphodiester phosphodiesterase [Thermoplasmata archaeon]